MVAEAIDSFRRGVMLRSSGRSIIFLLFFTVSVYLHGHLTRTDYVLAYAYMLDTRHVTRPTSGSHVSEYRTLTHYGY